MLSIRFHQSKSFFNVPVVDLVVVGGAMHLESVLGEVEGVLSSRDDKGQVFDRGNGVASQIIELGLF
jgi:hypothetical protein